MKRLLKTLIYMVLPLSLSACSGLNFGNNDNNSKDGYTVVEKSEARDFAGQISNGATYNHVEGQYKYKFKQSTNSSEIKDGPLSYESTYDSINNCWADPGMENEYASTSFGMLYNYYSFNETVRTIKNNSLAEFNIRYSIDKTNKKIKIEAVQQNDLYAIKIRLEYDASLYLRACLYVNSDSGTGYDFQVNSMYRYTQSDEFDWFGDTYEIYTNYDGTIYACQESWIPFYYRSGNHGQGELPIREFMNYGVISYVNVYNVDYYNVDWGYCICVCPQATASQIDIRIGMFDGNYFNFRFDVTPNVYSLSQWANIGDAISMGYSPNSQFFETDVWVAGFIDGYGMPTHYGSFTVYDNTWNNTYLIQTSTLRPSSDWLTFNGDTFGYTWFDDFYTYAPLGMQYGRWYYPDSLMIGDMLHIYYLLDGGTISFAFIDGYNIQNRMSDRTVYTNNLADAFNHAANNGEGRYIYDNIPMKVVSFYGTNTNPTQYGDFVVNDMFGNGPYTIYGSTVWQTPMDAFHYNTTVDKFTFTNPRNFMDLDYILGTVDNGLEIRPRDLIPGDILYLTFIIQNNMMVGVINGFELCSRQAKPEPEILTLSLGGIFERNDVNGERLYHTEGYISSFSTYGMYLKETMDSAVEYFVYNATFNTGCFTFNSTTGLYEFNGRERFGESHGELKVGDYVQMLVTRNDYKGTPELIGCVEGYTPAPTCQSISSDTSTNLDLVAGTSIQLTYTCYPAESAVRARFYSDDPTVATVDQTGMVTGISAGMSTNVWLNIDNCYFSWQINVKGDGTSGTCNYLYSEETEIHLNPGSVYGLSYSCEPYDARNRAQYTSSNTMVAEVDSSGVVYAREIGSATITVYIDNYAWSWTVYVEQSQVYCQSISSDYSNISMLIGDSFTLTYSTYPENVTSTRYFSSSNEGVVYVDSQGNLYAVGPGEATVQLVIDGVFYYWNITVDERCNGFSANIGPGMVLSIGETYQISVNPYPESAIDRVQYSSDNPSVASVNGDGLIVGVSAGVARITMQIDNVVSVMLVAVPEGPATCDGIISQYDTLYVTVGQYFTLPYDIYPAGLNEPLYFSSNNPSVFYLVDENGTFYATTSGGGTAVLYVGGVLHYWNICVSYPGSECIGITSSVGNPTILYGESYQLTFNCAPYDAAERRVFSSSNTDIATVDQDGLVTAVGVGEVDITLTIDSVTYTWHIFVQPIFNSTDNTIFLNVGSTYQPSYTIEPAGLVPYFYSSDDSIATVDVNGVITAVSSGQATIFVEINGFTFAWFVYVS